MDTKGQCDIHKGNHVHAENGTDWVNVELFDYCVCHIFLFLPDKNQICFTDSIRQNSTVYETDATHICMTPEQNIFRLKPLPQNSKEGTAKTIITLIVVTSEFWESPFTFRKGTDSNHL